MKMMVPAALCLSAARELHQPVCLVACLWTQPWKSAAGCVLPLLMMGSSVAIHFRSIHNRSLLV